MRKVLNQYTFKLKAQHKEKTRNPSLTVKGETYTIKELLEKHTRGIDPNIERNQIWQEDPNHDSIDLHKSAQLDIVEQAEQILNNKTRISDLETLQKEQKLSKKQQAKLQKELAVKENLDKRNKFLDEAIEEREKQGNN